MTLHIIFQANSYHTMTSSLNFVQNIDFFLILMNLASHYKMNSLDIRVFSFRRLYNTQDLIF